MILHYLKIAIRNLAKQKILAFINVFGLSVGIACFSLFLLYAVNEFSYDRFHENADHIFRVAQWWSGNKDRGPSGDASVSTPLAPALKHDFPDVENFVRINDGPERFVRVNNKISRVQVSFADQQIFKVFSFKLIEGDKDNALKGVQNVVITRDKAQQVFGTTDAVGKLIDIKMDDKFVSFKVGAVAENIPTNSSIKFDIIGNLDYVLANGFEKESINNWNMTIGLAAYVQLRDGSRLMNEPERLSKFRKKYFPEEEAEMKKAGVWDGKGASPISFILQPLRNVHTSTNMDEAPGTSTNPKNIWILISIASGVLLIACINFTTLAIGRSAGRAKEVGVRKVIGSGKKQLIYQFLTESVLLSILSGAIGLFIANMLLPLFNQLSERQLKFSFEQFPEISWLLAGLILIVGLLAGSYPALVLSSFRPVEVLKNKIKLGGSNIFTKSLVTVQFVLSIGLIISTIIIFQQLQFLRSTNIGFQKENVIVVDATSTDTKNIFPLFRNALNSNPAIIGITGSEIGLGANQGQMGGGYHFNDRFFGSIEYPIDQEYLHVMGMKLIAGRNFNPAISSDTIQSIIINEALAKNELGMSPEKALGVQLKAGREGKEIKTIIGVIKNFNFEPLNIAVRSQLFYMPGDFRPRKFFVRVKSGDPARALSSIQSAWKNLVAEYPFKYSFLDEDLDRFYKSEQKWSSIVGWAGGVSIFLACLGLFGLAALAAINRTKEIGIRKVLGASVFNITNLLSKDFLKLIIIALLIASPIAWYFMQKWLQDYAYRINIGWWVFASTGIVALIIASMTIGYQAIKAAFANPVKSLRTE
ncbi:MAG: ABC transporter permease [Bacteroidetes bacterium]|nr:ABC transporter permease [Bacteroidota bacterium]